MFSAVYWKQAKRALNWTLGPSPSLGSRPLGPQCPHLYEEGTGEVTADVPQTCEAWHVGDAQAT